MICTVLELLRVKAMHLLVGGVVGFNGGLILWGKPMQIAGCGHALKEEDDGYQVVIKGYTREYNHCVNYLTLCYDCFLLYSTEYVGILLNTEDEQHKWLRGGV